MSPPGIYVPGATTALTRRTTLRKAFLAPWHPLLEQCWHYALGDAQAETGLAIHSSHVIVTHHHTDVTARDRDGLVEFYRRVHTDMSKAINTLLCELRYDAPGEVWDDRPTHRLRLLDAEAQVGHHVYGHLNAVAAGLVARPEQMPFRGLTHRHWRGGPLIVDRPPILFDPRTRAAQREVHVTPQPLVYRLFEGDLDGMVHHLDRLCEQAWRRIRDARRGRPPLGAKGVRRIHPWSEPRTLRETRGLAKRTFKVGARDLVGTQTEVHAAGETTRFRHEHDETRRARRDGDSRGVYPYGTYAARVYRGAPVAAEPHADAVLAAPGPTLEDVQAELAARQRPDDDTEADAARRRVVDEVRSAFEDEAQDVVEHADLELCRKVAVTRDDEGGSDDGGVEVRHRFDPPPKQRSNAQRIVTLRDRRRGRPNKKQEPGGSSEPPG